MKIQHSISSAIDILNLFDYIHEIGINISQEPYPTYQSLLREDISYTAIEKTLQALLLEIPQEKQQQIQNFIEGKI